MSPSRVALIAESPRERAAWRLALLALPAAVTLGADGDPAPPVDLAVVVLADRRLPRLPGAPTLLVCPAPERAWALARATPHPLLITDPATAAQHLRAQLQLLRELRAGQAQFAPHGAGPEVYRG